MVGIVVSCVMLVTAHSSAVTVAEEQPTKLAMMEGMYDSEVPPLYAFGWVDEENQKVITPFSIPGGTSFLATGTWDTEYEGLNQLAASAEYGALDPETAPVNFVFQTYHLMVAMYGLIMLTVIPVSYTHLIRMLADRTLVMLDGRVIESGLTDQILEDPQHAYTQQLVYSLL